MSQIKATWWAHVSMGGGTPIEILSHKGLDDLASMIEAHLLKEYPIVAKRVLYPPSALVRVSKDDWAV
jgi:hypothetical protein